MKKIYLELLSSCIYVVLLNRNNYPDIGLHLFSQYLLFYLNHCVNLCVGIGQELSLSYLKITASDGLYLINLETLNV